MLLPEHLLPQFRQAVLDAQSRTDAREALRKLYERIQQAVDERKPLCSISGRCCRFEEFGHRLFVTTLELADLLAHQPAAATAWDGKGCPYQAGKLCSVHLIRPMGCRMFYCDPTAADWQQEHYERFHAELRRLHDQFGIPYFYVEWRQALK